MQAIVLFLLFCSTVCLAAKLPHRLSNHGSGRIVNGTDAAEGQFPFIASFRSFDYHICGGSVITSNFVITAGHCCDGESAEDSTVVVGTNSVVEGGQRYQVKMIHLHPEFSHIEDDLINDICLLHLETEIELNELVQIIQLNEGLDDSAQDAIVAGWGETLADEPTDKLQWLPTSLVPHQECVDTWGSHAYYPIRESQVCAFIADGQGACYGDSGGPLTTPDANGNTILTGLVSWGDPCAVGYPDVYTKVGAYIEWINSVING